MDSSLSRICSTLTADEDMDRILIGMWRSHVGDMTRGMRKGKAWGSPYWKRWYDEVVLDVEEELCEAVCGDDGEKINDKEYCESDQDRHQVTDEAQLAETHPCEDGVVEYIPEVLQMAKCKFEHFFGMESGTSTQYQIDRSALTVAGWATCDVASYQEIERERLDRETCEEYEASMRQSQEDSIGGSCWSFADSNEGSVESQNAQVAKLIVALGENDEGRMAILRAVAERQGIVGEKALQRLIGGKARPEERLKVPSHLRSALCEIGLHEALVPINVITTVERDGASILVADEAWSDIEFEVALDSGAVIHVCSPDDCPGYVLEESSGSKRGQKFLMGDGGEIPNLGQKSLNLCDHGGNNVKSIFQIAAVTRPLMSVGRICDEGHEVTFNATVAVVKDKGGSEICRFERQPGGLYVAKMKLKNPMGFVRPE